MESTLSLKKSDLESVIGAFSGYGGGTNAGETAWTTVQQNTITRVRKSGERLFYKPGATDSAAPGYNWSFLHPIKTMTLADGASTLDMPDDFGGFEGRVMVSNSDGQGTQYWPLNLTGMGLLSAEQTRFPDSTGAPQMAALEPIRGTSATESSRYRLMFWPTADDDYTLKFQYYLLPEALTDAFPYCYGAADHAETIKAACLAAAELELDNARGVCWEHFMYCMDASIALDRRNKPQWLGYNADRSDWTAADYYDRRREATITFNGVAYD